MKFCKDCRYILIPDGSDISSARCSRARQSGITTTRAEWMVKGGPEPTYSDFFYASTERTAADENSCGPNARFFEPKETT